MEWNDLRAFVAVHRERSFAGAARTLGVNATTVARRIERLEASLGTMLFQRSADGLISTGSAEAIAEQAQAMERSADLVRSHTGGEDARLEGSVAVSVTNVYASHFLLRHLRAFRTAHPLIDIEIRSSDALVDLGRGEAELAVRFRTAGTGPGPSTGVVAVTAQRIGSVGFAVYASKRYLARRGTPKSLLDLAAHDVVVHRIAASYFPANDWIAAARERAKTTLLADEYGAMTAAVVADFGLACLPIFVALHHRDLVAVGHVPIDARDAWLLMPADLKRVARVRALRDFVVALHASWEPLLSGTHRQRAPRNRRAPARAAS